jgi:beta-carotene 15,15'-dioxygenase
MAEFHPGWLSPALRWQSAMATAAFAAFCILALLGLRFDIGVQLAILLAGIVLVGFPHGAFDHLVARPVLRPRLGRRWWLAFLLGYLGLAGAVWLAWTIAPAVTLALFLAGSVLHFGLGDTEDGLVADRVPRWLGILTYGALPLLLPIALHPAQAAPVLAALAGWDAAVMERVLGHAAWLLPPWGLAFAWILVAARRERRGVLERLATAAGFVLLPPLLAFGLYFALGHAVRHVLRLGAWRDATRPIVAARWAAAVMLPASAICAAGLAWLDDDATTGLLAPAFRIIASLTLPHIIVTSWLHRCAAEVDRRAFPA